MVVTADHSPGHDSTLSDSSFRVFVSYRRSGGSADLTDRIADRLKAQFGRKQVFMDIDSDNIRYGQSIPDAIRETVASCHVLLVVIGKAWATTPNRKTGQPRLRDPEDWVRIEVETGLRRGIPVIPLLVKGVTKPPNKDALPASLQPLSDIRGIPFFNRETFESDVLKLAGELNGIAEATGSGRGTTPVVDVPPARPAAADRPDTAPPRPGPLTAQMLDLLDGAASIAGEGAIDVLDGLRQLLTSPLTAVLVGSDEPAKTAILDAFLTRPVSVAGDHGAAARYRSAPHDRVDVVLSGGTRRPADPYGGLPADGVAWELGVEDPNGLLDVVEFVTAPGLEWLEPQTLPVRRLLLGDIGALGPCALVLALDEDVDDETVALVRGYQRKSHDTLTAANTIAVLPPGHRAESWSFGRSGNEEPDAGAPARRHFGGVLADVLTTPLAQRVLRSEIAIRGEAIKVRFVLARVAAVLAAHPAPSTAAKRAALFTALTEAGNDADVQQLAVIDAWALLRAQSFELPAQLAHDVHRMTRGRTLEARLGLEDETPPAIVAGTIDALRDRWAAFENRTGGRVSQQVREQLGRAMLEALMIARRDLNTRESDGLR